MNFYIETLGCKVNLYESEYIKQTLIKKGFSYVEDITKADIAILNTCSVTNNSDNKSLKRARFIRKNNPDAIFALCGCSSQNDIEKYSNIKIDIVLGNKDKSLIPDLIEEYIKTNKNYINICNPKDLEFENMFIDNFSQVRAYIKIQDGCENFCSYCVIPYVRGKVRFKLYNEVLKEVKSLANNNIKEIVLTGIHTGSYPNLVNLISDISKINGIKRIRISSIEITELKEDFIKLLKNNNVVCDHLHIPLQAGSDEILKRMNRKYDLSYYENKINDIRKVRPDISISTDVIVGHPYENDDLFEETLKFCEKMNFSKIHVFPYSDRKGTAASRMDEHVSGNIIKNRVRNLIDLSNILEEKYKNKFINKKLEILIESNNDNDSSGYTSNYIKIKVNEKIAVNQMYNVVLEKINL